jgi:hypothetical protein
MQAILKQPHMGGLALPALLRNGETHTELKRSAWRRCL